MNPNVQPGSPKVQKYKLKTDQNTQKNNNANQLVVRLYKRPVPGGNQQGRGIRSLSPQRDNNYNKQQRYEFSPPQYSNRPLVVRKQISKKQDNSDGQQLLPRTFKIDKIDRLIPQLQGNTGSPKQSSQKATTLEPIKKYKFTPQQSNLSKQNSQILQNKDNENNIGSRSSLSSRNFKKQGSLKTLPKINHTGFITQQQQQQQIESDNQLQQQQHQTYNQMQQQSNMIKTQPNISQDGSFFMDNEQLQQQNDNFSETLFQSQNASFYKKPILRAKDFLNMVKTDPELENEFCFLNKRSHPYDWEIVDYEQRNPRNYMTISARGIQQHNDGDIRFLSMEEWEREYKLYEKLIKIEFFKNYKIWKSFSVWKKLMRQNIMHTCSAHLSQKLFFLDHSLRQPLIEIKQCVMNINQQNFFEDSKFQGPVQFDEFKDIIKQYRQVEIIDFIKHRQNEILQMLEKTCQNSLGEFKKKNHIGTENQENDQQLHQILKTKIRKQTVDLLKQKKAQHQDDKINFTQEATIRTHCMKLKNFIKLVDYIILDAKIDLVIQATLRLSNQLKELNAIANEDDTMYYNNKNNWITINISQENGTPFFQPTKFSLQKLREDLIQKNIETLQENHCIFLYSQELKKYTEIEPEEKEIEEAIQELSTIILRDNNFKEYSEFFDMQLEIAYQNIEIHSQKLLKPLNIHKEHTQLTNEEGGNKEINYHEMEADHFEKALEKYKVEDQILKSIEPFEPLGLYLFNCMPLKQQIENSASVSLTKMQNIMPILAYQRAQRFSKQVIYLYNKISYNPSSLDQFVVFLEDVKNIENQMDELLLKSSSIQSLLFLCQQHRIPFTDEQKAEINKCQNQMSSLRKRIDEIIANQENNLERFRRDLEQMIPILEQKVKELDEKLQQSSVGRKNSDIDQTVYFLEQLNIEIDRIKKEKKDITIYEEALQVGEVSNFEKLDSLLERFFLMKKLWKGKKEWRDNQDNWKKTHFKKLNLTKIKQLMEEIIATSQECSKEIEIGEVAIHLKRDVEKFQNAHQALVSLNDSHIGTRQWEEIRKVILQDKSEKQLQELNIQDPEQLFKNIDDEQYSLDYLFQMDIDQYCSKLNEISVQAVKEQEIIKIMNEIEEFWKSSKIKVIPYKEKTESYILESNENNIQILDENLLTLNNLLSNRYVENIRNRVQQQLKQMNYLQKLLDQLYLHQINWIYLEPILQSKYAQKNLVKEYRLFSQCDSYWRKLMKNIKENSSSKKLSEDYKSRTTLENIKANNRQFQSIKRQLDDFLERKKETFKRLFFLSNEELLIILSKVQNLHDIQPHLRKVFDNIESLEFDVKENVTAIVSMEGQAMQLKNCSPKGEIEEWLISIEDAMITQIKSTCQRANIKYDQDDTQHTQWVLDYPTQTILIIDGIWWTKLTEDFLNPQNGLDLYQWYESTVVQIEDIIEIINSDTIKPLQRMSLISLVVQEVNFRDIVLDLVMNKIEDIDNFEWQKRLRYYSTKDDIYAMQLNMKLNYGYEYTGASPKLVITPLTDKCWITITQAFDMKLGAAPFGDAGSGKSESVKDLSRTLGRLCIVFNCSKQITANMIAKIFIGLCFTGSWACLDEFNRIDIEVLSVIAQQILTIRQANLRDIQSFFFSGRLIALNENMGICITMNPDYTGRTELPHNLKPLFRPVSMMVPDYVLIGEVILYSEGFNEAQELSKKLYKLYKLCAEQLSQQNHYDFGMRAVKSVLTMAGVMRKKFKSDYESDILISACKNTNLPKLVNNDIPLFSAILQDLFPNHDSKLLKNEVLEEYIYRQLERDGFKQNDQFAEKVLQLNEALNVRVGVIIVGPSLTGKSNIIKTLENSLNMMKFQNYSSMPSIQSTYINPRAQSMNDLYGNIEPITNNFNDGILSLKIRQFVQDYEQLKHDWIIFDGPVDSMWAENLNTVLDESKTFCLPNGERIKLKDSLKLVFEALELQNASPSTISRCGVIYVDDTVLNPDDVMDYMAKQEFNFIKNQELKEFLIENILSTSPKFLKFINQNCNLSLPLKQINIVKQIISFVKILLINQPIFQEIDPDDAHQNYQRTIEKLLIFSFFWSVSTAIPSLFFGRFERYLWDIFPLDPVKGSLANFYLQPNRNGSEFAKWDLLLEGFTYQQDQNFHSLFVSTKETVCYSWIYKQFLQGGHPIYLNGVTGTGKSIIIKTVIKELMDQNPTKYQSMLLNFNPQTQPVDFQSSIELRLEQHRKMGKNYLMPPHGQTLIVFIDDLNLPQKDQYGVQSVLELIRYFQEFKGFQYRQKNVFKYVESIILCAAATTFNQEISPKLLKHYAQIQIPPQQEDSLHQIFTCIFKGFLQSQIFKQEVKEFGEKGNLVQTTLQLYEIFSQKLLPVPSKQHYKFSLRDVSRVFQGLLRATPNTIVTHEQLARLWAHEVTSVFYDRLVTQEDREFCINQIVDLIQTNFKLDISANQILGNDILNSPILFIPQSQNNNLYEEVFDFEKLVEQLQETLDQQPEQNNIPIHLFSQIIEIVVKTCRVISLEKGHFIMVAITGSGKRNITQLASILCNIVYTQHENSPQISQFYEELYNIMKIAAFQDKQVSFFIEDTGLDKQYMQDINHILQGGILPSILQQNEIEEIQNTLSPKLEQSKLNSTTELFATLVQKNLRVVIGLSPVGSDLRYYFRNYRNFLNFTTIKWIEEFNSEALQYISQKFIDKHLYFENLSQQFKNQLAQLSAVIYESALNQSKIFQQEWKRSIYITPKNYLDFLSTYINLLEKRNNLIGQRKDKLAKGVHKIENAKVMIKDMQDQLQELQPKLEEKSLETTEIIKKLEIDKHEASQVQKAVEEDEKVVLEKKQFVEEKTQEAEKILNEAKPQLKIASEALNTLNRNDISEIKQIPNPHALVKFTMECVAMLLDENTSWDSIKKFISDMHFLQRMKQMNNIKTLAKISPQLVNTLKEKIKSNEDFRPKTIKSINLACKSMCEWVLAVLNVIQVYNQIQLKKKNLDLLKQELKATQQIVQKKKEELEQQQIKVHSLEAEYQKSLNQQQALIDEKEKTEKRINQAKYLLSGLAEELERWKETMIEYEMAVKLLPGDVFIASACVTYFGSFTQSYRTQMIKIWMEKAKEYEIPIRIAFSLDKVLANHKQIRQWQSKGLPQDDLSTSNAVIVESSNSSPYLIDPQLQALYWLKRTYGKQIISAKMDDDNLIIVLEKCLINQNMLIVESGSQNINSCLQPILQNKMKLSKNQLKLYQLKNRTIEIHPDFKLFLFTKESYPQISPTIFSIMNVINFTVTQEGLEDRFLGQVVSNQMPEIELEKQDLINQIIEGKNLLFQNENRVLQLLNSSDTELLDDNELIENLRQSKQTALEVKQSLRESEKKQKQIQQARQICLPIAKKASILFQIVNYLTLIDHIYQFSLKYFSDILEQVLQNRTKLKLVKQNQNNNNTNNEDDEYLQKAIQNIITDLILELYKQISQGLYNKHKKLFAFCLIASLQKHEGKVSYKEWEFFSKGLNALNSKKKSQQLQNNNASIMFQKLGDLQRRQVASRQNMQPESSRNILSSQQSQRNTRKKENITSLKHIDSDGDNNSKNSFNLNKGSSQLNQKDSSLRNIPAPSFQPATNKKKKPQNKEKTNQQYQEVKLHQQLQFLSQIEEKFEDLYTSYKTHTKEWEIWVGTSNCARVPCPQGWESKLSSFQKLLLIKIFKEEQIFDAIDWYISQSLGKPSSVLFQSSPYQDLAQLIQNSKPQNPIFYFLSVGSDPLYKIQKAAYQILDEWKAKNIIVISSGQGQGELALKSIQMGWQDGRWVVIQNLHLGQSQLPKLDSAIEEFLHNDKVNPNFRLFMTSMPCDYLPVSILQQSIKITDQPPKGVKLNMLKIYSQTKESDFEEIQENLNNEQFFGQYKQLFFAVQFLHVILQERKKFGALGWNITYDFNENDLETSNNTIQQAFMQMNQQILQIEKQSQLHNSDPQQSQFQKSSVESINIPWDQIQYIMGQINYGGRITDEQDQKVLAAYINKFCSYMILDDSYKFSKSGVYHQLPIKAKYEDYVNQIKKFPDIDKQDIFGLYESSYISLQLKEIGEFFQNILQIQPKGGGSSQQDSQRDKEIGDIIELLYCQLPQIIKNQEQDDNQKDIKKLRTAIKQKKQLQKQTTKQGNQMDLLQSYLELEVEYFNKLIKIMEQSLQTLQKAIKGEIVIDEDIEQMLLQIYNNQVPFLWKKYAQPTCKPLAGWYEDFLEKFEFFNHWYQYDKPLAYWLGAFFYPQGFLTTLLQQYSRQQMVSLDQLRFKFVFKNYTDKDQVHKRIDEGCFIYGMYMEGCRFNASSEQLEEHFGANIYQPAPIIHIIPEKIKVPKDQLNSSSLSSSTVKSPGSNKGPSYKHGDHILNIFQMPVYKTVNRSQRQKIENASQVFQNHLIMYIDVPIRESPDYWILKGSAFFCELNH